MALFRANDQLIDWRLAPWTNSQVVKGRPEHKVVYVELQGPQKKQNLRFSFSAKLSSHHLKTTKTNQVKACDCSSNF